MPYDVRLRGEFNVGYGRQYAAHTATTLAAAIVMGALFYVLRIVLFQSLSVESYGLFYAVFAFGVTIQAVVTFGFDPGIAPTITRLNEGHDPAGIKHLVIAVLIRQLALALVAALGCIVFAEPLTRTLFDDRSASDLVVPIIAYMVLMVVFKTGHTVLLGLHAIQARNLIDIVRVCVALAELDSVIFTTFGDAIRVPGSTKSLLQARAEGCDVRMVYSPLDALKVAKENPQKEVVFFGLGFETTTPSVALTVLRAESEGMENFSVFCNHITIIPTLQALLESPGHGLDVRVGYRHTWISRISYISYSLNHVEILRSVVIPLRASRTVLSIRD